MSGESDRPAETGGERTELSLDTVFEIIRNERRRLVLAYLEDAAEERVTLSDLAEHIAAIENDTTVQGLTAQQRKRVYVALYQSHLPKMADAGIVSFNKNRGVVEPGPNMDQLRPYLDADADDGERGHAALVLGGAAVIGYAFAAFGGLLGAVAGGIVVFTALAIVSFPTLRERLVDDDG